MHGNDPNFISFDHRQGAELGLTNAGRMFQHSLENRLQLSRRGGTDDLKDLQRRGLLLQGLGQLALGRRELPFQLQ